MRIAFTFAAVFTSLFLFGQSLGQTVDDANKRLDRLDSIVDSKRYVEQHRPYQNLALKKVLKESDIREAEAYVVVKSYGKDFFQRSLDEIRETYPEEKFDYFDHPNSRWVWIVSNTEYAYDSIGHAVYQFRKEGHTNSWSLFVTKNYLYRR